MLDDEWQAPFDGAFDETTKSFPYGTLTEGANPDVQTPPGCVRRMLDILQGYGLDFQDGSITFVDIGCSVGAVTNMVAEETRWSCFGIDISVKHLELARVAAKKLKEPSCVTYLEADYLEFDSYMPAFGAREAISRSREGDGTFPSAGALSGLPYRHLVFYMYLIPKMFTPTFGREVARLLEGVPPFLCGIIFPTLSGQASPCTMTNSSSRFTGEVEFLNHYQSRRRNSENLGRPLLQQLN